MRFIYFSIIIFVLSCSSSQQALLSRKSLHEQYSDHITKASLHQTAMGSSWINAGAKALQQPLSITLPYQESGYFAAAETDAQGYRFNARRGEKVLIAITKTASRQVAIFIDLWLSVAGGSPKLVATLDTSATNLPFEVKEDGTYILRLQPELLASADYNLSIKTAPSLGFPVAVSHNPRVGSFWGDRRDAGARNHEGIDIFGGFRTPIVAAANGIITSVSLNNLGGKVIFLRPDGQGYALYYAHLDSQIAREGQRVHMGDTIGLMGNTGNAKNTPTHLHFGIYAAGGAIDPFPFVNRNRPEPTNISADLSRLKKVMRNNQNTDVLSGPEKNAVKMASIGKNTILTVKAATGSWYKIRLPDEKEGFIPGNAVSNIETLRTFTVPDSSKLLDKPDSVAATIALIEKGKKITILGVFRDFNYIAMDSTKGWMMTGKKQLRNAL